MNATYSIMTNAGSITERSDAAGSIAAFMLGRKISDFIFLKKVEGEQYGKVVDVMPCEGDVSKLENILETA
jgi:hypothetical protein